MESDTNTFKYRFCKSSWGVAIDINAEQVSKVDLPNGNQKICEGLYVQENLSWLSDSEKYFLSEGACLSVNSMAEVLKSNCVVLIKNIVFNFTDYQEEGLAIALAGWLDQFLKLEHKEVDVGFNKESNKYLFSVEGKLLELP